MPLYAFGIAQGVVYTRNYWRYVVRLFVIACISQVFYTPLFATYRLNMVFTLLGAALLLKLKQLWLTHAIRYYIVLFAVGGVMQVLNFESGLYGILLVDVYASNKHILQKHFLVSFIPFFLELIPIMLIQTGGVLASLMIIKLKNTPLQGFFRNFYRIFYPFHLAVLYGLRIILLGR
jgi:hypothetical protein